MLCRHWWDHIIDEVGFALEARNGKRTAFSAGAGARGTDPLREDFFLDAIDDRRRLIQEWREPRDLRPEPG